MQENDESFGIIPVRIIDDCMCYLLIQHHAGHWGFPKGHAEGSEQDITAACREFEEETGIMDYQILDNEPIEETYKISKTDHSVIKTVRYYIAKTETITVHCQESEIRDFGWFNYGDAYQQISFKESKHTLVKAMERLKSNEYK
jgi:bis(5'-nucleosidyl)-tetraphosphatase